MEFRRVRRRGQDQKTRRTWLSDNQYRVTWRREIYGVRVPARFQATVRTILPNGEMWDFVGRRLFKTFSAAQEGCEKHEQLWTEAVEVAGIRGLQELFGKVPLGFPAWVKSKLSRKMYSLLMDTSTGKRDECETLMDTDSNQSDPTNTSGTSATAPEAIPRTSIPALPAKDSDQPSTGATTRNADSPAKSATGPAKGRKKRVTKPTVKSSRATGKKRKRMKGSGNSEGTPSRNSAKKKSPRSGN